MVGANRRDFLRGIGAGIAVAAAGGWAVPATAQGTGQTIRPTGADVLVVVDVQNCFVPGGSLAVAGGDEIVPVVNRLAAGFEHVILTQDWHPPAHVSFASAHPGKKPFEVVDLPYGPQVLWPDHCVQGTPGAELHKDLQVTRAELVIRKGYRRQMDSYSAFYEADRRTSTGLTGYLRGRALSGVFLAGLATDFCVGWSAVDAARDGFATYVIEDACRAIDVNGSLAKAWADMQAAGVRRIQSSDLAL